MNIPYHKDIKILGFQFTDIVHSTAIATWSSVTARVRAIAQETYYRVLSMDRRIQFVHEYLLSKTWFVTQIFPHRLTVYDRLIPQYLGLYGGGKYSESLFPLSSVGKLKGDGTWLMHGQRAELYSCIAFKCGTSESHPSLLDG